MKIAYIATSTIPSSTANSIQVMKVCQALTQNGEDVELLIPGRSKTTWNSLSGNYGLSTQFPITRIPSWRPLKRLDFVFGSLRQAKGRQVELIYTRLLWAAVGGLILQMPVVLELHDLPVGRFGPWLFRRFVTSRKKKLTVVITDALRKLLESKFSIAFPGSEILIAPDGVDIERYNDIPEAGEARKSLGLKDVFTAAYSGGFYEGRGLESLLELAGAFPQIQFLWIGGKPEQVNYWKAKIKELGLVNIILTGFVANSVLPLYQAAADVLLMPYSKAFSGSSGGNIAEVSSPMKMFEYMAAGRAILSSDIAVLREVLNDSNTLFYTPEDLDDMRKKFSILLEDEEKRKNLAEQAKIDVEKFTWQARMKKIITFVGEGS